MKNPYKPGAGHMPPHLAGRKSETRDFLRLLDQEIILSNVVLTGLRGVGKTVLLETWKPIAIRKKWLWVGTDLSESTSVTEYTLVTRLLADLSVVTARIVVSQPVQSMRFINEEVKEERFGYEKLVEMYKSTPGLP